MNHRRLLPLALSLALGCTAEVLAAPSTFDADAPMPTYRATGGYVIGELDGAPYTSVEIDAHAGPMRRFAGCSTQTVTFWLDAIDEARRELSVQGTIRFSEDDGLRGGAPVIVGPFGSDVARYEDPPEGGAHVDAYVSIADRGFSRGERGEISEVRLVDVCEAPDGPCFVRVEIEGRFTFEGVNERVGERREATLEAAINLESAIVVPREYAPTVFEQTECPPPGSEGSVRLVGTRLEVFHDDRWGAVCSDSFGAEDALVACRQLGYSGGDFYPPGTGNGAFWMAEVACTGTEARLVDCAFAGWGVHDCNRNADIGLHCR